MLELGGCAEISSWFFISLDTIFMYWKSTIKICGVFFRVRGCLIFAGFSFSLKGRTNVNWTSQGTRKDHKQSGKSPFKVQYHLQSGLISEWLLGFKNSFLVYFLEASNAFNSLIFITKTTIVIIRQIKNLLGWKKKFGAFLGYPYPNQAIVFRQIRATWNQPRE